MTLQQGAESINESFTPRDPQQQPSSSSPQLRPSVSPRTSPVDDPAQPAAHPAPGSTSGASRSTDRQDEPGRTTPTREEPWPPELNLNQHDLPPRPLAEDTLRAGQRTPETEAAPEPVAESPPEGHPGKRHSPSATDKSESRLHGSPTKKPRLVSPGSLSLLALDENTSAEPSVGASPLFYPSASSQKLYRLASLASNPDTATSMMSNHDRPDGVTTLRLPQGQVTATSPARSSGTPLSWSSTELSSVSRSPDGWPQPSLVQLLQGIGVVELLEQDDRATFIIDLNDPANFTPRALHLVYANVALRTSPALLGSLQPTSADSDPAQSREFADFKEWAVSLMRQTTGSEAGGCSSATYAGLSWTSSTLRKRFRIIRAHQTAQAACAAAAGTPTAVPSPVQVVLDSQDSPAAAPDINIWTGRKVEAPREPRERSDYFESTLQTQPHVRSHSEPRSRTGSVADTVVRSFNDLAILSPSPLRTTFDWTRIPIDDPNLPEHHRFARSIDWAATSLGPVELWPMELRILSTLIMGSPHPAALYWGWDHVAIYNEAYITVAGQKHPRLMGSRYQDAWPEIWDEIQPVFEAAWNNGYATMKNDDTLFIWRHGYVEETSFNWGVIPLVGADGTVVALYNPAFENTRRKIAERRMLTLREIGIKTSQARDTKSFWTQLRKGLEYNELDAPFALIYSAGEDNESEVSSLSSGSLSHPPQIVLQASIGVADGHPCAVRSIDLRYSDEGFARYMRESLANSASPIILSAEDGTLPTELLKGVSWTGYGDPCRTLVVFPVHPTTASEAVVGFIVLGINPRRPYDADYQLFVNLLSRQLATSLASVVLFEEEIRRGQKAAKLAALDRQELSLQLHLRTQEAVESEYRFTRMAEFGPVGLFIADGNGHINYCNEMWYRISGLQRSASTFAAWMQSIRDEDRPATELAWRRVVEEKKAVTHEFRFKGSRELIDGHCVDVWALMSAYPETDELGGLKSIFGCITDISQQKWAEDFQKQRREEAVELKRQQENFIDITSHEMRNPLSAILQCADEISSGLSRHRQADPLVYPPGALDALVDSCIEAANIISLCANHQKRIVDDILTLSKLDSNLLLVTPVDVEPISVVRDVLKMFETELGSHGIDGRLTIEQSYRDLDVDWVKLDPSRLRQVLINLMTNAIKFTQGRPTRSIVVSIGASRDGGEVEQGLSYLPPRQPGQDDFTNDADWADGDKINLHFAVTDTGTGLDDDEKRILFQRFSQASPRTHVKYGGSGLGLFICKTLTELQGGQIAVQSEKGLGSTFAFYIKGRKSNHPRASSPEAKPLLLEPTRPALSSSLSAPPALASISRPTTPKTECGDQPSPRPPPPQPPQPQQPSSSSLSSSLQPNPKPKPEPKPEPLKLDVLIVEDNLVNQKVLQRQLHLSGSNTQVANHGGEALAALRRSRFWNESAAAAGDDHHQRQHQHQRQNYPSDEQAPPKDNPGTDNNNNDNPHDGNEKNNGNNDDGNKNNKNNNNHNNHNTSLAKGECENQKEEKDESATKDNISVILMDLEMPVMDGITCTREIRRLEREGVIAQHIPIVAVTAYARPEQVEHAKAAGVDGVISKPFRISELIPKIEELVVKYNMIPKQG